MRLYFHRQMLIAATIFTMLGTLPAIAAPAQAAQQNYLLATASTGGTYYPVGVALATLIKVKLQPKQKINMSAINSAGSGENIKLLRTGEVQFAILQGLYGAYARRGTGPLASSGPQKHLRSVTMLWANVEHFVVRKDFVWTGTMADIAGLKGEGAALGAKNSGTLGSNRTILSNLGYNIDRDFKLFYAGYGPSVSALNNRRVNLISTPAGAPVAAVTAAFASLVPGSIQVLDFTDEEMKRANGKFGDLWTRHVIPSNIYPGQTKPIRTIAQPNFLAVRNDVPEETIYQITKTIYNNLGFLKVIHRATRVMSLKRAIAGLPLPLHPGAARFYKEKGISIPSNLKP
jgi:TRAP transporter TAXI family solute receptor